MCKKILFPAGPVIEKHGGVEALSKLLGYKYQRVHNWISRGIPALEIALRPEIFIVDKKVGAGETAQEAHDANVLAAMRPGQVVDLSKAA